MKCDATYCDVKYYSTIQLFGSAISSMYPQYMIDTAWCYTSAFTRQYKLGQVTSHQW